MFCIKKARNCFADLNFFSVRVLQIFLYGFCFASAALHDLIIAGRACRTSSFRQPFKSSKDTGANKAVFLTSMTAGGGVCGGASFDLNASFAGRSNATNASAKRSGRIVFSKSVMLIFASWRSVSKRDSGF